MQRREKTVSEEVTMATHTLMVGAHVFKDQAMARSDSRVWVVQCLSSAGHL
jgi:hypothetical protein